MDALKGQEEPGLNNSSRPPVVAYSPKGASDATSLSLRTIRRDMAAGRLRSFKKGRRRIIFASDLRAYLRQ